MKSLIILMFSIASLSVQAQQISLKQCLDSALANYSLSRQNAIYQSVNELEAQNIKATNLPQADLTAKATWQSEVMELPIAIPNLTLPELNKDQYKMQLEISQSIYKGGMAEVQKRLSSNDLQINVVSNEIELSRFKAIIISLYFQTALLDKNLKALQFQRDIMIQKLKELQSLKTEGMALEGNIEALQAEILTFDQRIIDLSYSLMALKMNLSQHTKMDTTLFRNLALDPYSVQNNHQNRPEIRLMELNKTKLEILQDLNSSGQKPIMYAFSTLGYGRPGLNYLTNEFSPYAIVGVGVNWKIWNWNQTKTRNEILKLQSNLIQNQQDAFNSNLLAELSRLKVEIDKQQLLVLKAGEVVDLRKKVLQTSEYQLKEGVIRITEYIEALRNFEKSTLEYETAKVKLALANVNYQLALGII